MTVQEWLGNENELGYKILNGKYKKHYESLDEFFSRVSGGDKELKKFIMLIPKMKKFIFRYYFSQFM